MGCVSLYLQSEGGLRIQRGRRAGCAEKDGAFTYARALFVQPPFSNLQTAGLVGDAAHGDGVFDSATDLESYCVDQTLTSRTPALALYAPASQRGNLVFRSKRPLMTPAECGEVLRRVDEYHAAERGGVWGTVRKSSVKTTDVAVEDIPVLRPWLKELLRSRLYPMLDAAFPVLADGSTTMDAVTGESRMRVHDAFIVRYDAEKYRSLSLPEHSDTSAMSFTLALNERGADFEGGGTWFEALGPGGRVVDADLGRAVAFAGPLRHAGYPITAGVRIILVLFLYIDGFTYGQYLSAHSEKYGGGCKVSGGGGGSPSGGDNEPDPAGGAEHDGAAGPPEEAPPSQVRPSGDMPGGYVVYNQTVELVAMLNKEVASVLD